MRFVTFKHATGPRVGLHIGALGKGMILDVAKGLEKTGRKSAPATVLEIIERADEWLKPLRDLQKQAEGGKIAGEDCLFPEAKTTLLSPIPRPLSMRDGYAFRQHVEAARRNRGVPMIEEFDHFPVFYFTNHLAVTGPGEIVVNKMAREKLDFELEAAIVTGKTGRDIPASEADAYIFGYLIMNDWSARALQMEEMKLNLGPAKGKDFATSLGPYLVTPDELRGKAVSGANGARFDLTMKCHVNGKEVSSGNLKDMSWTFAQILERVSYGVTIHAGEVIGSGTVGTGCFLELNGSKITDNQWLKPGDEVVMEIEGLGRLVNTIAAPNPDR